ncbi:ubl carboxyl-terminal hydrolase 18 [Chanos chanos]|uniref:Ubl carboxyl-terminal hydrolase 18 n=1 Tax=Chanos chanos TaxID=29144 RepID=A0A6J2WIU3_CHACN|nr:ubl carboxyl-terminal hydrolase 18 [Chanos chanos]
MGAVLRHSLNSIQGVTGLMNYGNSCCANALLQSLCATGELADVLDKWKPSETEDRNNNVPVQLKKVLLAMRSNSSASHRDFLMCLDHNSIRCCQQHDVDEVFLSILNLIQQQMTDRDRAEAIRDLFKVTVMGCLTCSDCTYQQTVTSFLLSIPLSLREETNSLQSCIQSFFKPQELAGSDSCYCERCGKKTPSSQGLRLVSLPPIVCVHLKRFRNDHGYTRKLYCEVNFPEVINFGDVLNPDQKTGGSENVDHQYILFAVIVHMGTARFGHYTAYVRPRGEETWYYTDDSCTRQVRWEDVQKSYGGIRETAYMLLYRRDPTNTEQEVSG